MTEALAERTVTVDHARELTLVLTARTEAAMGRDEAMLVEQARRLPHAEYRSALRHWKARADPDGTDPGDHSPSEWTRARSIDGTLFTKGRFNTEDGETITRAVDDLVGRVGLGELLGSDGQSLSAGAIRRLACMPISYPPSWAPTASSSPPAPPSPARP